VPRVFHKINYHYTLFIALYLSSKKGSLGIVGVDPHMGVNRQKGDILRHRDRAVGRDGGG